MVVAGSALALGWWPRAAAAMLAGSLVPTTLVGHPFWRETTRSGRAAQQVQFLKNLGLLGGLLLVLADELGLIRQWAGETPATWLGPTRIGREGRFEGSTP
jgi:uncharacterized membrane protein YphA (DoxX/SURF4 family)